MTLGAIDDSQRNAAKVAGFLYLFLMATAIFFNTLVTSRLIVPADAARTAANIMASERLFRTGIVFELITCAGDVALAIALYVLLKPVSRSLALLGAFWRLAESTVFGVIAFSSLIPLLLLGSAPYLQAFPAEQLQALARVAISAHGMGFQIAFFFLALGAMVFSYLLFKSHYVPRAFGVLGMFAYTVMLIYSVAVIVVPGILTSLSLIPYAPAFVFEVGCGLWFLVKGVNVERWNAATGV